MMKSVLFLFLATFLCADVLLANSDAFFFDSRSTSFHYDINLLKSLPDHSEALDEGFGLQFKPLNWPFRILNKPVTLLIDRLQRTLGNDYTWSGSVKGDRLSMVVLTAESDNSLTGSIYYNGQHFEVNTDPFGNAFVQESHLPNVPFCDVLHKAAINHFQTRRSVEPPAPGQATPYTIDVMGVYTNQTETITPDIVKRIKSAMRLTNEQYFRSGIRVRFRLVQILKVTGDESASFNTALTRISSANDGYFDEINAARDASGAEVVVLFTSVSQGLCGLAYRVGTISPRLSENFAVVEVNCLNGWVVAHEIGHLLGSDHGGSSTTGVFTYSHGYTVGGFTSIMWTDTVGTGLGRFSDPQYLMSGGAPFGTATNNDNVRSLTIMAPLHATLSPDKGFGGASSLNDEIINEKCVIATAAADGNSSSRLVESYRNFRDHFLMKSKMGRTIVATYYSYAPPVANLIREHDTLKSFIRISLTILQHYFVITFFLFILVAVRLRRKLKRLLPLFFVLFFIGDFAHAFTPQAPIASFDPSDDTMINSTLVFNEKRAVGAYYSIGTGGYPDNEQTFIDKHDETTTGAYGYLENKPIAGQIRLQQKSLKSESPLGKTKNSSGSRLKAALAYQSQGNSFAYGASYVQAQTAVENASDPYNLSALAIDATYKVYTNFYLSGQVTAQQLTRTGFVDNLWLQRTLGLSYISDSNSGSTGVRFAAAWVHNPRSIKKMNGTKSANVVAARDEYWGQADVYLFRDVLVLARYFTFSETAPTDEMLDLSTNGYTVGIGLTFFNSLLAKAQYTVSNDTDTVHNNSDSIYLVSTSYRF